MQSNRLPNGGRVDRERPLGFRFNGVRYEGEEGWIQANWHRKGGFQASDINILKTKLKGSDLRLPQRHEH